MRSVARPVCLVMLTFTVCSLAIAEGCWGADFPLWFKGFALPIIIALMAERAIRKSKGAD